MPALTAIDRLLPTIPISAVVAVVVTREEARLTNS